MSSELDAALAAAGRAGAMVLDSYNVDLHTDDDMADLARAVLDSLGLEVTGWEHQIIWSAKLGETKQRRRTVESAWEDVT